MTAGPQATVCAAGCALCGGDDDAAPVAVGANFADPADRAGYLVLRCRRCGLLYTDPRPEPLDADGAGELLGVAPGSREVVVFDGTLERCADPVAALARAREALGPGGRVRVVAGNADGAAARLLAGRHWAGYDFPRRLWFFSPATLRAVAERAGLRVERLAARADGACWARSLALLRADVGGPTHPADRVRRPGAALRAVGAALDAAASLAGRGARLEATLRPAPGA